MAQKTPTECGYANTGPQLNAKNTINNFILLCLILVFETDRAAFSGGSLDYVLYRAVPISIELYRERIRALDPRVQPVLTN